MSASDLVGVAVSVEHRVEASARQRPVRVFISYAHESDEHQEAVRQLWTMLRTKARIDARLDLAMADRRLDWVTWMQQEAVDADFVIVVASPAYRRRAEGDPEPDDGRGVQFEAALLRELFYTDRRAWLPKLLPVVLPGQSAEGVPLWLSPQTCTRYEVTDFTLAGTEALVRTILGKPRHLVPELGPEPDLPPLTGGADSASEPSRPATPLAVGLRTEVVLRVAEVDGQLVTGLTVAGTPLGEHAAGLPYGVAMVWTALPGEGAAAAERLASAGRQLTTAMFDEGMLGHLVGFVHHSAFGSTVDVIVVADETTADLPYELLQLPDGRPLVTAPGVSVTRRLAGVTRSPARPLPGPLKILAAVAAPAETRTSNPPLDVEAEMQAILDSAGAVGRSGDAQVTILEVGALEQIGQALREDQYHVLHLSAHGSPTSIELETEDGDPVQVDAQRLVETLRGSGRPLPLIVLSSCAGAASEQGLAATLVRHGADRVIGMQTSVTDDYATVLAAALYRSLVTDPSASVATALGRARREVEEHYALLARAEGRIRRPEYAIATLLAAGDDPPLRDPALTAEPLREPTVAPSGRSVRELPVNYLIGRRTELRTVLSVLRGTPAAVDRFGAVSGVAVTGVGGIGKTAVAGRTISRLRQQSWAVVVHDGRWNPPQLFGATADALLATPGGAEVSRALADPGVDDGVKLQIITDLLAQVRLVLVFDDFEQNLTSGGHAFSDPAFEGVFTALCDAADEGRLLVTCRHPVPGHDATLLHLPMPPLTPSELRRMFLRLPGLRSLEADDRRLVARTIGGHPRLIEFVDALLRDGRSNLRFVAAKLRTVARNHHVDLAPGRNPRQVVSQAVLLGSRDILLEELLTHVSDEERELLLQAALSSVPLALPDLAFARYGDTPTEGQQQKTTEYAHRLLDLTLFSPAPEDQVTVHPWISEALRPHQGEELAERHDRAYRMHHQHLTGERGRFDDIVEAGRHLAALARYDELTGLGLMAPRLGIGTLATAALLGELTAAIPTDHRGHQILLGREAVALLAAGNLRAGGERLHRLHRANGQRVEADPDNAEAQRSLFVSHNNLGNLAMTLGDTTTASNHYRNSLTIAQYLAETNPSNAQAQRDLSISHNKLGNLAMTLGDTTTASNHYLADLTIAQHLAETDPGNAQAQRDLSVTHGKLGDLAMTLGDTTTASNHYLADLTIAQHLAETNPSNAQAQRDLSVTHEKLGELAMTLGDTTAASNHYRNSLTIRQHLAEPDPSNAQAQRDLSISHNKLGDLAMTLGDTTAASNHYRNSLTIRQHLAETDPSNAQAQRDLSVSHNRLGDLAMTLGDTTTASNHYLADLTIAQHLAETNPDNAQTQRDLSISHNRLGDLAMTLGDTTTASNHYRNSLTIRQHLAERDPSNAQAQREMAMLRDKLSGLVSVPAQPGPPDHDRQAGQR
ncbi:CHAT domain-containing protein [Plantactinospora sp. S1510]|uniref:CHAT domain-containing protein n=1 Tax=Plantactinospora alkalitolerans TaxID=2789879 RepID=A0ABS0GUP5_9ACTN|nr:CHAT domain-containing protein [Plantactinospora alkalitolerans]MBF9129713.1 CHAT domain-containing protein [Plantactinospora alkalitolerans]